MFNCWNSQHSIKSAENTTRNMAYFVPKGIVCQWRGYCREKCIQTCWSEKLPGIVICLPRLDPSAALRSWPQRKWDSRVLTQTKLDMDIKFWETSRCPDRPSSCLTSDNRETNAKAEQSSILPGFICRRPAKTNSVHCVMMWHGETTGNFQMWRVSGWGGGADHLWQDRF